MNNVEASPQIHPLTPSSWLPLISPRPGATRLPPAAPHRHPRELEELRAEVEAALSEAAEPPGLAELRGSVDGILATLLDDPDFPDASISGQIETAEDEVETPGVVHGRASAQMPFLPS